jgi:Mechanosensitive ion channel
MDRAFEAIINFFFFLLLFWIFLGILGVNPYVLWGTIISFMISFKFMIGTVRLFSMLDHQTETNCSTHCNIVTNPQGCADYFEGILMVLCQRPYDIGDRIATSYPYIDTSTTGSSDWIVRDVNLYSTTVAYGSTNELATHSNGALSTLRIINATRSPRACLSFHLKFPINTSFAMIQVFKLAMEKFVRAKSREVSVCGE